MNNLGSCTLPNLISRTVETKGAFNAFSFVGEKPITYSEAWKTISALISYFEKLGIKQGDNVAILSSNMPNWSMAYFAITSMGAVTVPILPDFTTAEIENILKHSETKALLVSENLANKISDIKFPSVKNLIRIEDFSLIDSDSTNISFDNSASSSKEYVVNEDDIAAIIYTSGTTGKSKGVMLTHKNICFNASKGYRIQPVSENDRFLSILPLSHTYENTLGLLLAVLGGACVYYLRKPPTPAILLPALKEVKPTIMLSVPLIIEKIYRNKILPAFTGKWYMKKLYGIPAIRKKLNKVAGKKLMQTFGGEVKFFGIGGAKLSKEVEEFLIEAQFPYAIGYGLTETSPLLAGTNPGYTCLQSTGPAIEDIELIINNPDPVSGEGEIWARGPNIMKGYYKEPDLTKEVLTPDGWFKTGDLGVFDKNNYLYIMGRIKNVILSASGENIYPEEIESMINRFQFVTDSLVVQKKGKLVALVHFNQDEIEKKYHHLKEEVANFVERKKEELGAELHQKINERVNKFSKIHSVVLQPIPFQKTATHKIKRFLYI